MSLLEEPTPRFAQRCAVCDAALAHDQRYCINCGARRGPPPTRIAVALGELAGRPRLTPPAPASVAPQETAEDPAGVPDVIPIARAAAVSILLMLGVGSVIGAATTPGGVTSLARTIVVAIHPATRVAASAPGTPSAATGGGRGGGGGGHAPGQATGSGGGSSSSGSEGADSGTSSSGGGAGGSSGTGGGAGSGSGGAGQAGGTGGSGTGGNGGGSGGGSGSPTALPPIGHVWEIVLSDEGYAQSFGAPKADPYLARTLARQGELFPEYDAVAGSPLANEIALTSGQGPTAQTVEDCPEYTDLTPGRTGRGGQVRGSGCLYPASTQNLGQQFEIDGLTWRAYIQGVGTPGQRHPGLPPTTGTTTTPPTTSTGLAPTSTGATTTNTDTTTTTIADTSTAAACPHPAEGAVDGNATATATGGNDYVTWKNPWVYFQSTLATRCATHDVGLGALARNLRRAHTTPAFSYIAPDPCDDGSATPCRAGAKGGLGRADAFLRSVVPEIERSPAYRDNGLILITFDQSPQAGPNWSTASCCDQPTFPNLPATTSPGETTSATTSATTTTAVPEITGDPPGGGQVGLLMISPYVKPDLLDTIETYNHFSLLKSVENLFGLPHLGYAADKQVPAFVPTLFLARKR